MRRRRSSSAARARWYELYRRMRMNLRAMMEARADAAIYGFGMTRTNTRTGHVEHVPISQAIEIWEQLHT